MISGGCQKIDGFGDHHGDLSMQRGGVGGIRNRADGGGC